MKYDTKRISALSAVFPRVRLLRFNNTVPTNMNIQDFQLTPKTWNSVESIEDSSPIMNVTLRLLRSLAFDHLTSVDVTLICNRESTTSQRRERAELLIEGIRNVPLLEILI